MVTDITHIRTGEAWLYLAVIIDLYSALVVGWSMSQTMEKQLVIQSVLMALWQKQHDRSVIIFIQTEDLSLPAMSISDF